MLKYLLPILLFVHGLIHAMGFAKSFDYGNITQLSREVSKTTGLFWLLCTILFIAAGIMCLLIKDSWIYLAFTAVIISQVLIILFWQDAKFGTILNIIILVFTILSWASFHFKMKFKNDVDQHMTQTIFSDEDLLKESDIASLPLPVQKYIRYTGAIGKPKLKNMKIVFDGEMRDKGKGFFKFTSVQYNFFESPARLFFMKAQMYGTTVCAYHCYQNATATMQVKLLGLFNVVNVKGIEMNKAETVTLFNDMCLLAPASLIDKRIEWKPINNLSTSAVFTNGENKISATLYFNEKAELINFISDDRYAVSEMKKYRFSTPVKNYITIDGHTIMQYGEAVWHYPEGEFVYGKFNLNSIKYNVSEQPVI